MGIRRAIGADALSINKLVSSLSHFYLQEARQSLPEWFVNTLSISEFERRINGNESSNYVYLIEDEIVGYISIKGGSHLYHLFVLGPANTN